VEHGYTPWWQPVSRHATRAVVAAVPVKTLCEIAGRSLALQHRPAWWARGDAPSMEGKELGAGTCSYGAPAGESRRNRPRAQRTRE